MSTENRFERPGNINPRNNNEGSNEQINEPAPDIDLETPSVELLEKIQSDPRVHYVPSLKQLDFSSEGSSPMNLEQYYHAWQSGQVESHKAGIFTFQEFIVDPLNKTLNRDLADQFPVSIRGVALNIGETINKGQPDEILGIKDVLILGTERRDRTGQKIPALRYEGQFPHRSEQWLRQSPKELREILGPKYKDQIFPAVLVYKADQPELIGIYITDYLDESKDN